MDQELPRQDPASLLRREPEKAYRLNTHLRLRDLADGEVTRFLSAEAWPVYLTLLYALMLFRRRHELAPLHEDLYDRVRPSVEAHTGSPYDPGSFASDMKQLVDWGCVRKDIEAARIRGYRDRSRENFRYALTRDAVSFLEWLEARLEDRVRGNVQDGRELLLDLVARLQEILKVVLKSRSSRLDADSARRLLYLLEAVDEGMDLIVGDLTSLRAEMHAFARGLAPQEDLKKVVARLEKYVAHYLRRMRDLGVKAYIAARRLAQSSRRNALRQARDTLEEERIFRRQGPRHPDEILDAALPFLKPEGQLAEACSRVDGMASEVVRRVQRHLRDIEARNFRLEELRARLAQMAALPEEDPRPAAYLKALVAFAHFRHDPHPDPEGGKARPPEPRRSYLWSPRGEPSPVRAKRPVRAFFEGQEAKRQTLREYVQETLLKGRREGFLSEASLHPGDDPLGWLAVAKARYLGAGRELRRAGLCAERRPGSTTLSADGKHLWCMDHDLRVGDDRSVCGQTQGKG